MKKLLWVGLAAISLQGCFDTSGGSTDTSASSDTSVSSATTTSDTTSATKALVPLRPQQPRAQHQLIQTPALRLYLLAARPEPAHGTALAHGQAPQPQRTPAPGAAAVRGERTHGRVAAAGPGN